LMDLHLFVRMHSWQVCAFASVGVASFLLFPPTYSFVSCRHWSIDSMFVETWKAAPEWGHCQGNFLRPML
jgi:hypothetical protein